MKKGEKKEVAVGEAPVVAPVPAKGERQARWEAHVANYKKDNPVKAAQKEARGEFKDPPPSFK